MAELDNHLHIQNFQKPILVGRKISKFENVLPIHQGLLLHTMD